MAREEDGGKLQLSRRDFLKASGAAAAAGMAGVEFAFTPSMAAAADVAETYHTTCPYCSASCGQLVDVDATGNGNVLDIYGDPKAPWNAGGLCAKGAGALQLVTNKRRVGAFAPHAYNSTFAYDPAFDASGVAYRRDGAGTTWTKVALPTALADIATRLKTARGTVDATNGYNSKTVAFLGCSHMNNEQNNTYRKIIANFGTTNTEHQARI